MSLHGGYFRDDTIAAIATGIGGAIAIVRLSGPKAFSLARQLASLKDSAEPVQNTQPTAHGQLQRTTLFSPSGQPLDDAMVVYFKAPKTYTGEDLVEFHTHGGAYIVRRVLEHLISLGARQALAGEFSFRAVRNGKLTLFQSQGIADLILAKNDQAIALAMDKLSGHYNDELSALGKRLRELASLAEVGIDFADQDIEEVSLETLKVQISQTIPTLERLKNSYERGSKIQEGIRVVFAGPPNVGKSSFFNALIGDNRSIVSSEQGTTRDIVQENITLRGAHSSILLQIQDTAGLRTTQNEIEKQGISRSKKAVRESDLVLFVVDASTPHEFIQREWALLLQADPLLPRRTLGIFTKSDLHAHDVDAAAQEKLVDPFKFLNISTWFVTSAHTGSGIKQTIEGILTFCESWTHRDAGEMLLTHLEHYQAVDLALTDLARALASCEIELFAADLRQALHNLGPLIGHTVADDLLAEIFSRFCIGK